MSMFIAVLVTIAGKWNRCPFTDRWVKKKVIHIHSEISLSYKEKI